MNVSSSPNITFMLQYTEANSQYVDYTNRDEAVKIDEELSLETNRQMIEGLTEDEMTRIQEAVPETQLNFKEYIDYMNRSYATENQSEEITAVFTQEADYLQKRRLNDLKNKLESAYQNGSLLWQGVISFDNAFLAEQGLYDVATGQVDQKAIKAAMRDMMPTLIQKEGLSDSAFWWGNIHLNTDNIHIHFGLSEVESNREKIFYRPRGRMEYKGNFSQKTINRFKSGVYHGLLKEETRSNILRKEQILANLKADLITSVYQEDKITSSAEKNFLEQAYNHLPLNKKWRYGSNARDFAVSKFFLDRYLDSYLKNEGSVAYQEFLKETREFLKTYEGVYSAEKNQVYEKLRKVDGQTIRTLAESKGYDLEHHMARRVMDLRERLANNILRSFKEAAPQIQNAQLEKNLDHFSILNQQKILEQYPEASVVKSLKAWQKLGYSVKAGEHPLEIIKPVYEAYDKTGKGIGKPEFVSDYVYDVNQLTENIQLKTLTLKDLSLLSSSDLKELVDAAKLKPNPTEKERRELGTYRYALKLSMLEASQKELQVRQKLLEQIQPLASDQPFVDFKKQSITQELQAIQLQLTPNYKLSEDEQLLKQRLKGQFEDSVALPINKATAGTIQLPIRQLRSEIGFVNQLQDDGILTLLKGVTTSKEAYVEELQTHISIFQLKYQINTRNQQMNQLSDESAIKEMKIANAQGFTELKRLYAKLQPSEENQSQITQAVSKQLQERKVIKKAQIQQSQGSGRINTDFMRQLTASLKRSQQASKKALMERARSDEREEQEERRQAQR
ncbi:MAG: relaxase MobL [Streptococcus orisratti]|uniref:MobP2 family relaxase n=1 Tax=Streptococcus orisratti TaxID=114652 RepID=UPI0023562A27|nr:MobP2 family relaxase [Streptococcus orisratti]MCI7677666.1 relaxase MobL [Streptococcus orisratti]